MQARKTLYLGIVSALAVMIGAGCSASVAAPSSAGGARVANVQSERRSLLVSASLPALAKTDQSTGQASRDSYQRSLARAYASFKNNAEGKNADYIPALAKVDPQLFGIALVTVDGAVYEIGSSRHEFSIQSVSKIFTLARAIELLGADVVEKRIGVNATGMAFNSITAIELNKEGAPAMNPLVNPGAIATVDALPAVDAATKWNTIIGTYSAFAARRLGLNQEVYKSESETNTRNRAIGTLLQAYEVVKGDVSTALDIYTRQCSVSVSARDLAIMGATLANGGTNPLTSQKVVDADTAERVLAVMATAGLYETTGQWMYEVSIPAKSGVGGGIVAVVPGRFAIGTFAPPLDKAGNSVKGQRAIQAIVEDVGASVFASFPVARKLGVTGAR
jgi:glutaminase